MGYDIPGLGSNPNARVILTDPIIKISKEATVLTEIYASPNGNDTTGDGSFTNPVATLGKAMTMVSATRLHIILMPGEYAEDVTWCNRSGVIVSGMIPLTVTLQSVTAFAISINPAAASGTWSATLNNLTVAHLDGDSGILVNNTSIGKRINLYLNDVDIESDEPTDPAINVDRGGGAGDSIRLYATGHGNTIEGLVDYITESTDDRVRFWGYRLVGGITVTGHIVNELTFVNCGIKTSGESFDTGNISNHFGCYNETDANPNVHTVVADDDETSN